MIEVRLGIVMQQIAQWLEKLGMSDDARPHWRAYRQLAPNGEWVELAREFSE